MEGALGVEAATLNRVVEEASWSAQVNSRRLPHASESGVTTATGRCIGTDAVVPERRHGASEIGFVFRERLLQLEKARGVSIGSRITRSSAHESERWKGAANEVHRDESVEAGASV